MNTNKQHLDTVNSSVTASELVRVVLVGLFFCFFTYLLWQLLHSMSQGVLALIRGLIPRIV